MNEDERLYYSSRQVRDVVDEAIREAMANGEFDNLKGKGKPLQGLEDNPYEDPNKRLANKLLRDNNLLPAWMEIRRTINQDFANARERLKAAWDWYEPVRGIPTPQDEAKWNTSVASFQNKLNVLNKRIKTYNLKAPNIHVQLHLFYADQEIQVIMQSNQDNA